MTIITTRRADVHIRWLINADMPEVMAIENHSFPYAWSREDFRNALRQRNAMGMVAEIAEKVVGFAVYELHLNRLQITNLAVHFGLLRRGIGSSLIAKMASKLNPQRRKFIRMALSEQNTEGHLFLKACGFKAVAIVPDYYEEAPELSAYIFELNYRDLPKCNSSTA